MDPGLRTSIVSLEDRPDNDYHLPPFILSVVYGPSMSGKTTYILNLLFNEVRNSKIIPNSSVLKPEKIYIFAPSLKQDLYQGFLEMTKNALVFVLKLKHSILWINYKCLIN